MMTETEKIEFLTGFAKRMGLDAEDAEGFIHHSLHWQGELWLEFLEHHATVTDWKKYNENFINHITDWDAENGNLTTTKEWRVPMAGGKELCVQICRCDPEFPEEIIIYLKHKDGFAQDIALVRPHYDDSPFNSDFEVNRDQVDVLVYADDTIDDYSHKFIVEASADEEEVPAEKEE